MAKQQALRFPHGPDQDIQVVDKRDLLKEETTCLLEENIALQQRISTLFYSTCAPDETDSIIQTNDAEKGNIDCIMEKIYHDRLSAYISTKATCLTKKKEYEASARDLKCRLSDRNQKAEEITLWFAKFKREIADSVVDGRTGKPISVELLDKLHTSETEKNAEIAKLRLRNICFQMSIRNLEKSMRSKENLGEGVHLIDYEQLKTENSNLHQKTKRIELDICGLKESLARSSHMIAHAKEKINCITKASLENQQSLHELKDQVLADQEKVTALKQERDKIRHANDALKQQERIGNSDLLTQDFLSGAKRLEALSNRLSVLKRQYIKLSQAVQSKQMDEEGSIMGVQDDSVP